MPTHAARKSPVTFGDHYPRHPSGHSAQQDRMVSDGSVRTQATFPIRADAYVATDLGVKASDIVSAPASLPPPLPYPSLAKPPRPAPPLTLSFSSTSASSARSIPLSLPSAAKSAGGFFSSIGRRSSTKREQREQREQRAQLQQLQNHQHHQHHHPALPASTPPNVLSKLPPVAPRPAVAPVVPGGPRAPPNRVQRSQTLMLAPSPPAETSPSPPTSAKRRSSVLRRPSVFTTRTGSGGDGAGAAGGSPAPDVEVRSSPDFVRQVDKLADLLPHVEKHILAGYLRRAGQDILAIGAFDCDTLDGVALTAHIQANI